MKSPFGATPQTAPRGIQTMTVGDLQCEMHMPPATESRYDERGVETVGRLARSELVSVYRVDDFQNCPPEWERSDPARGIGSFFVLARPRHMVWFNFNRNAHHSHHVAAVVSAQGLNAITGQNMTRSRLALEQYADTCPIHHIPFTGTRKYCSECGFEWPDQNYIATTSVRPGYFWRDGFCAGDHVTREFVFTENEARGVAKQVIGDDRVNAFGVALFLSRDPKPQPRYQMRGEPRMMGLECMTRGSKALFASRSIEVAAGARVDQTVERDSRRLDFWNTEPSAVFIIYYVGPEEFERITGMSCPEPTRREGFINDDNVGNP